MASTKKGVPFGKGETGGYVFDPDLQQKIMKKEKFSKLGK
jgi:hypothetical protein